MLLKKSIVPLIFDISCSYMISVDRVCGDEQFELFLGKNDILE